MTEITKRHEIKYIITNQDYQVITGKLNHILKRDAYSYYDPYTITSLYYDDHNNQALQQKIDGDSYRYKYRIRYYNNDLGFFKLEKKEKIHTITNKESAFLNRDEVEKILNNDTTFLLDKGCALCEEFYYKTRRGLLKPKVIVEYERLAFVHQVGNLRVTFDTNIKASLNDCNIFNDSLNYTKPLETGEVVMEVKFNGEIPSYLKSVLQVSNGTQTSMSKYVYSRQYNYNK